MKKFMQIIDTKPTENLTREALNKVIGGSGRDTQLNQKVWDEMMEKERERYKQPEYDFHANEGGIGGTHRGKM